MKKLDYVVPMLEMLELNVEQGFAVSDPSSFEDPDMKEEQEW